MTIEELQASIEELNKKLEDKSKELDGIQSLKGKWSNEVGDVRKEMDVLKGELKSLTEDRDAVKKELEALKSKADSGKVNLPPVARVSDKELADKLETELTDAEKVEVEELWKKLPDSDKKAFVENDAFRVAVLKQAKAIDGKVNPDSPWRVKPKPSGDDLENKVKDLFKKHRAGVTLIDERGGGFGTPRPTKEFSQAKFL
jgi:chromosome segregation ATPase